MAEQGHSLLTEEERRDFIESAMSMKKSFDEMKAAIENIMARLAERRDAVALLESAASTLRKLGNAWETIASCLSPRKGLYDKCYARIEKHEDHYVVHVSTPVPISLKLWEGMTLEDVSGEIVERIIDMYVDFVAETARRFVQALRAVDAVVTELKLTVDSVREMHERVLLLEKRLRELEKKMKELNKSG